MNIKQVITLTLALLLVLGLRSPTYAQDTMATDEARVDETTPEGDTSSTGTSLLNIKDTITTKVNDTQNAITTRVDETQAAITETVVDKGTDALTQASDLHTTFDIARNVIQNNIAIRADEIQTKVEQIRDTMSDKITDRRARFSDSAQNIIDTIIENIVKRYLAALDRFSGIADRIQSRIDKMQEDGQDASEAQRHLNIAVDLIVKAHSVITDAIARATTVLEAEEPRVAWQEARDLFREARAILENIKEELRAAAEELHKLNDPARGEA